jgi:hypothetical protein
MLQVCRKIEQGTNADGRSGGLGGGNLQISHYEAPIGWQPRILSSDISGVTVIIDTDQPLKVKDEGEGTAGVPPETMTGNEF